MLIIKLTASESGGRPPIQPWDGKVPEDYAEVICDTSIFYAYRSFVTLTVENGKVVGMTGDQTALDAYLAEFPDTNPTTEPEPDVWDEIAGALTEGVRSIDQ